MTPRALWIVLGTSFLLKLGLLATARDLTNFADERQFIAAALTIAADGAPGYTNPVWDEAHYPPVYPYLLGGLCKLFELHFGLIARILQVVASTVTAWLVYVLAERLFDRRTALWSAGVWAFLPAATCYTHLFLSETLFGVLATAVPLLLLAPDGRLSSRRALAAGLVAGLAALTRSIFFLQAPLVALWLLAGPREGKRLRMAGTFLAGLVLVIAPWSIGNTLRYGRFLLIDTGAGNVLHLNWNMIDPWNQDIGLIGRHQRDRDAAKAAGIERRRRYVPEDPTDIVERNQGEIRLALDWLADHPGLFVRHTVIRAAEFLNPTSMLVHRLRRGDYGQTPRFVEEALVGAVIASTLFLLGFGLVGMVLRTDDHKSALVALLFLSAFAAAALLMSITRYRFPTLPLLVPYAVDLARNLRSLPPLRSCPIRWTLAGIVLILLVWISVLYLPYNYPHSA